jgi:hypothetical protein
MAPPVIDTIAHEEKIMMTKNSSDQLVNEVEERERERKGKESDTVSGGESTSGRERERRGSERERGRQTASGSHDASR